MSSISFEGGPGQAINMNTIDDLVVFAKGNTIWNTNADAYVATSADHTIKIGGLGSFNNPGGKPGVGSVLDSLNVRHSGILAYQIHFTSSVDLFNLIASVKADGAHAAFVGLLSGNDAIVGGTQADILHGYAGNDSLNGLAGNDTVFGDRGNDHVYGNEGDDKLYGGLGDDYLDGSDGKDTLDGGAGNDTTSYYGYNQAVTLTLNGATFAKVKIGGVVDDSIKNIENVYGGRGNDHLAGDKLGNSLWGMEGNDFLEGRGGNDRLDGRLGNDLLKGGAGIDLFVFDTALGPANVDTIADFTPGQDLILLSTKAFANLKLFDPFHEFFAVGAATETDDRIIYKPGTGDLVYDADGIGIAQGVVFAHLPKNLALNGFEFLVTI